MRQGANKGATTAFLISTPESGVDSMAITYALLDPIMTVIRPVAALFSAMMAGLAENCLFWQDGGEIRRDRSCLVDNCCDGVDCPDDVHDKHHTFAEKMVAGIRFGYREVWGDIAVWFFVGLFIAALITVLVPEDLMARLLGGGLSSMLVMLMVGIPLYICASASTPVAAALIMKGVSPGAALVFLLVGPATNVTSISVLLNLLGKKSTALYLVVISVSAVLFGLGTDALYQALNISPRAIMGEASEVIPIWLKVISALLLLLLSLKPLRGFLRKRFAPKPVPNVFFSDFPTIAGQLPRAGHTHVSLAEKVECGCGKK
jgi:uncharacterized membrane protein YraQ (UPF0718 family)